MIKGTFDGAGGLELAFHSWLPEGETRGSIVVVHGFKAHGGMYAWAAQQLNARGFAVHVADLRGHGASKGERYHVEKFEDYVADLTIFTERVRAQSKDALPLFVLGHSAGGVIAAFYALEHQKELAGFICEDFAYALPPPDVALALLKGVVAHLAPHAHLLNLKAEDFSRDEAFVATMKNDPLAINTPGTVQLLAELIRADARLKDAFPSFLLPLLILHGTDDHIAKIQGSKDFYAAADSADKTLKVYEGHYHDLLSDVDKEIVMEDILTWLDAHLVTPSAQG